MINKKNLNEQIYETLKRDIFTHKIESGSLLVNKDLQNRFGVSSSPIRDAINRLEQDGLIGKITRAGAEILTLDYKTTKNINDLMIILSMGSLDLYFNNEYRDRVINELQLLVIMQENNLYNDKFFYYDYSFHKLFFLYSENEKLIDLYNQYSVLFEMASRSLDEIFNKEILTNNREHSLQSHKEIILAFENNDLVAAKEAILEHYNSADEVFKKYLPE